MYVPLVAKLLLLFGLPVAIGVFWQRRLRTHWNILALASLAFLVHFSAMKLLNPITSQFDEVLEPVPGLNHQWELRIAIYLYLAIVAIGLGQILIHVPDLIEIQAGAFVIAMLCLIPIFLLGKPMTEKRPM